MDIYCNITPFSQKGDGEGIRHQIMGEKISIKVVAKQKESILAESSDPGIEVIGGFHGKFNQTRMVDCDSSDMDLYHDICITSKPTINMNT